MLYKLRKGNLWLIGVVLIIVFFHQVLRKLMFFGTADFDQHVFWGLAAEYTIKNFLEFPHFNMWACGGIPLLGNYQSRFLSPYFILEIIFGANVGLKLSFIASSIVFFTGVWKLLKSHKIQDFVILPLALITTLNGQHILHLAEGHSWILAQSFVPWFWYFWFRKRSLKDICFSSIMIFFICNSAGIYTLPSLALCLIPMALFNLKSIKDYLYLGALSFALCSPKLVAAFFANIEIPRFTTLPETSMPFYTLYYFFFHPSQKHSVFYVPRQYAGWHDFSMYIGITTLLLLFIAFFKNKKTPKINQLSFTIVFIFFIGLGDIIPYFWKGIHEFPIFKQLHLPTRFFLALWPLLALGLGLRLTNVIKKKTAFILTGFVFLDLFFVLSPAFRSTLIIERPSIQSPQAKSFEHSNEIFPSGNGPNSIPHFEKNTGPLECYEAPQPPVYAEEGTIFPRFVKPLTITPNSFEGEIDKSSPFVMNFNYSENFYCLENSCTLDPNSDGRIKVTPHKNIFKIRYVSKYFYETLMIMFLTFIFIIYIILKEKRKNTHDTSSHTH